MLGILRIGYDTPGATIGVFKTDEPGLPRLAHLETLLDAPSALQALQNMVADDPIISVYPCPTEVVARDLVGVHSSSTGRMSGLVTAEYYAGKTLLLSRMDPTTLSQLPHGPVLSESACLIAAFTAAYEAKLHQYTQVAHLHLSEKQIDLFVYDRAELVFHGREIPDQDDRASYETSIGFLLGDEQEQWRSHLDLLVISGASRWVKATQLDWLDTQMRAEIVETFDAGRLYIEDLTDADAQRAISRPDSLVTRTAIPVLLAGAAHSFLANHGADFRNVIKPQPTSRYSSSGLADQIRAFFGSSQMTAGKPQFRYFGLLTGILILAGFLGWQYYSNYKKENTLTAQLALERKRAEANRTMKQEAENFKTYLEALNNRINTINKMRQAQGMNYQISSNVRWQAPKGIVLTDLKIEGRNVFISGYVSVDNASLAQTTQEKGGNPTPANQAPPPPPQPGIDVADAVTAFVRSLEGSGKLYSNIQSTYKRAAADKSEFTITCTYQGEVISEPIFAQPIPNLVVQAAGSNPTPQPSSTPK